MKRCHGGVDAQHVRAGLQQGGYAGFVVAGVDARADDVALVRVEQLVGVLLVALVVLAEDEVAQAAAIVDDGQGIELVLPDDVVGLLEGGALLGPDQLFKGGHEAGDLGVGLHAGHTVVTAGDNAHQLALGGAVLGDGDGGVAGALLELQHVPQSGLGAQVGVAADKAGLVALGPADHGGLVLDGLGAVNEADAAFFGEGNGQTVAGNGLHDGGHHGDVHPEGAVLFALAELYERRGQIDLFGAAADGGVAGDQQIFVKSMGGFVDDLCHVISPFLCNCETHFAIEYSRMRQKKLAALRFRGLRKSHENCALLSPSSFQNQSGRFDFERKTEGTDMQLSRLFETGEAK